MKKSLERAEVNEPYKSEGDGESGDWRGRGLD